MSDEKLTYFTDSMKTLDKVYRILYAHGVKHSVAVDILKDFQNHGVLIRERDNGEDG